jgi:hypothetical protein
MNAAILYWPALALLLAAPQSTSKSQPITPEAPAAVAAVGDHEQLKTAVWEKWFRASAHVRYHQKMTDSFAWWGVAFRWSSIVMGILAFSFPLMFQIVKDEAWKQNLSYAWSFLGLLALIAALWDAFSDNARLAKDHAVVEQQWNTLAHAAEKLFYERGELTPSELKKRLDELNAEDLAIERAEPPGEGGPKLDEAYREEAIARGVPPAASNPPARQSYRSTVQPTLSR